MNGGKSPGGKIGWLHLSHSRQSGGGPVAARGRFDSDASALHLLYDGPAASQPHQIASAPVFPSLEGKGRTSVRSTVVKQGPACRLVQHPATGESADGPHGLRSGRGGRVRKYYHRSEKP